MDVAILEFELYGGTLRQWLWAAGLAAVILLGTILAKRVVLRRLAIAASHTHTSVDDALVAALQQTRLWLIAIFALALGGQALALPARVDKALDAAATIALFVQLGLWASSLLEFWLRKSRERAAATNAGAATSLSAVGFVGRIVLWALILLLALDNLGINITTLVAGLGIGGVAVALAVQNILGDLFASLSIVLDKPFAIGDFIILDDYMGTVEHIGLKTTRIRSLSGEQIVFSNSDLLKGRIRNYKRMYERRVVFKFGVLYQTTPEQLEQIPPIVKRIIEAEKQVRFDRAHFFAFGESSLDFEVVFWVTSPDYNVYMDIQQRVNLKLMRELAALRVEFAYPTRTLFVESPLRVETTVRERLDGGGEKARGEPAPPPRGERGSASPAQKG